MKKHITSWLAAAVVTMTAMAGCADKSYYELKYPTNASTEPLPEGLPDVGNIHTYKAPLYWTVYEYMITNQWAQKNAIMGMDEWVELLDWFKENLLPYGYDMVCTDGAGATAVDDGGVYTTRRFDWYEGTDFRKLVELAHERGIKVGIYDNPLWMPMRGVTDDMLVPGTQYTLGSLKYDEDIDKVYYPNVNDDWWFTWYIPSHPGCRELIDGFFKHYHDMGVDMIRMDFLSWFEDGWSRVEHDYCSRGYGRANYARWLGWCAESAKKYGIFLSLVMPNMYNDAELESRYGHMARIVSDTHIGTWKHTSGGEMGCVWKNWPSALNMFDGFTYWSHLTGKDKLILDGDFTRLNTYANDDEKEFTISIQLLAGGPIAVADRPSTIGDNLRFYQNREMLALNADHFVGKPMDDRLLSPGSNIWHGAMSDGSYIIGFFNREEEPKSFSLKFSQLGLEGEYKVRDLWRHTDEGTATELKPTVPAHGCKIVKLTK